MADEIKTPVDRVCERFGGRGSVSKILDGRSEKQAFRWDRVVPAKHHERLLSEARRRAIPLEAWEFTMTPDEYARVSKIRPRSSEAA